MNTYFIQNATVIYLSSFSWWPIDLFTLYVFLFSIFGLRCGTPENCSFKCRPRHVSARQSSSSSSSSFVAPDGSQGHACTCICMHNLGRDKGQFPGEHHVVWSWESKTYKLKGLLVDCFCFFLKLVLNDMFYHRVKWLNKTTESFVWKFVCLFLMKFLLIFLQFTLFYYFLAQYLQFRSKLECFLFLSLRM